MTDTTLTTLDVYRAIVAAEMLGKRPRYVVMGQREWYVLRHEARTVYGHVYLDNGELEKLYGLDVVRVDVPELLQLGY